MPYGPQELTSRISAVAKLGQSNFAAVYSSSMTSFVWLLRQTHLPIAAPLQGAITNDDAIRLGRSCDERAIT